MFAVLFSFGHQVRILPGEHPRKRAKTRTGLSNPAGQLIEDVPHLRNLCRTEAVQQLHELVNVFRCHGV